MNSRVLRLLDSRDADGLFRLMSEHDDWLVQLDAAEALVGLGDRRGIKFLMDAEHSEDEDVRGVVKEIMQEAAAIRMRQEYLAEEAWEARKRLETARKRLEAGRPVFRYQMVYIAAAELLNETPSGEAYALPALDHFGVEGWEVTASYPRRRQIMTGDIDDHFTGAFFLLKKALAKDEAAEIESASV